MIAGLICIMMGAVVFGLTLWAAGAPHPELPATAGDAYRGAFMAAGFLLVVMGMAWAVQSGTKSC